MRRPPRSTLFPYNDALPISSTPSCGLTDMLKKKRSGYIWRDRKSTRLNSSHSQISYAVLCLKKKNFVRWSGARPDEFVGRANYGAYLEPLQADARRSAARGV